MRRSAQADVREDGALARAHPLTLFGLDALIVGALRVRPDNIAVYEHDEMGGEGLTHAQIDHAIGAFAERLGRLGLQPGASALLCCAPRAQSLIAFAAMRCCGVEPVLAPLSLLAPSSFGVELLTAAAQAVGAQALFAPTRFGDVDFEPTLLAVAAQAPSIRLLGALTDPPIDGAMDFSFSALRRAQPEFRFASGFAQSARTRLGALGSRGFASVLGEDELLAAALELLRKDRASKDLPIVSLASPGSFGGLVAGPLAALLSGAPLHFLAPFRAARFLSLLDRLGPVRLVAPTRILPDLSRAGLLTSGALASLTILSEPDEDAPASSPPGACPVLAISGATVRVLTGAQSANARVA